MPKKTPFAKALTLSVALGCASAFVLAPMVAEPAFAKSEKSNDKGSKEKSTKDKSSKSKGKKDRSNAQMAKASKAPKAAKPKAAKKQEAEPKAVKVAKVEADASDDAELSNGLKKKNISAALGALNAANASDAAFENASPNSRVGKIAAYRDQVLANEELRQSLTDAETLLNDLDAPELTAEEYAAAVADSEAEQMRLEAEIKDLRAALDADAENEDLLIKLHMTESDLAYEKVRQNGLVDPEPYAASLQALEEGRKNLAMQEELAGELLNDAANKSVTDDMISEVHRLLGLTQPEAPTEDASEDKLVSASE